MNHVGKSMVVMKHICHGEEVAPVMSLFTHPTDERETPRRCIGDIECHICHILPCPPETKYSSEPTLILLSQEYYHEEKWKEALKQTPTKNSHKFSKRHKYHMSCLMEYEIHSVNKRIHDQSIDTEGKKLNRVSEEEYEKNKWTNHT